MAVKTACLFIAVWVFVQGFSNIYSSKTQQLRTTRSKGLGIYNGEPSTIQNHPHLVAILWKEVFVCAGAIISDNWVITSAMCLDSLEGKDLTVVASSNDGFTGDSYSVSDLVLHPNYDRDAIDYEYILVKIGGSFNWSSRVKPINLPTTALKDNTRGMVSGWGETGSSTEGAPNSELLQGGMRWLPSERCNKTFTPVGYEWSERLACAFSYSQVTLCGNDWGDPFVHNNTLYGIFVIGYPNGFCSSKAGPILLANILPVTPWIQENIGVKALH